MLYRGVILAVVVSIVGLTWWILSTIKPTGPVVIDLVQEQAQDDRLRELIETLRSTKKDERIGAQRKILELSRGDITFRNSAVRSLISIVENEKRSVLLCPDECYQEWRMAVETLGAMNAVEATDTLAKRITVNNGSFGLGIAWFPAATALVQIGEPAIPELKNRLLGSQSELERKLYIDTLHAIRTPAARNSLEDILQSTRRKDIKQAIRQVLRNW